MTNDIVEKLKECTNSGFQKEAPVVYIMVQIGKIIERDSIQKDFPVFCFYRDWVVHPQLDRKKNDARNDMYAQLDDAILLASKESKDVKESVDVLRKIAEAISFYKLEQEINSLFTQYEVIDTKFNYDEWFKQFRCLLMKVLTDLPLKPATNFNYSFKEFCYKESQRYPDNYEILIKPCSGISRNGAEGIIRINGITYIVRLIS